MVRFTLIVLIVGKKWNTTILSKQVKFINEIATNKQDNKLANSIYKTLLINITKKGYQKFLDLPLFLSVFVTPLSFSR